MSKVIHHQIFKGGWLPQLPDHRDHKFKVERVVALDSVYLASKYNLGQVFDQGDLGSCVSNSVAFLVYFNLLNKHDKNVVSPFRPSRLFIYYYGRLLEGDPVDQDTGLAVRTGIKVINTQGVPTEDDWAYDVTKFAIKPPAYAITAALKFESLSYQAIDNTDKSALVAALQEGYPISFGMTVYDSFMSDQVAATGIVPMPAMTEGVQGGHCMAIVGYRKEDDTFIVRNSWGTGWGQRGYCRLPAAYITNPDLASDFWIITSIQ